jgi:hypothetical protein
VDGCTVSFGQGLIELAWCGHGEQCEAGAEHRIEPPAVAQHRIRAQRAG